MIPSLILGLNLLLLVTGDSGGFGNAPFVLTPIRHTPVAVTVHGFQQCGGDGKILDWRNTACSGYSIHEHGATTTLCSLPTGIPLQHEVDFRAGRTSSQLKIKFFLLEHGNFTQVLDMAIENGAVTAGHDYTYHRVWTIPSSSSGTILTFKGFLYREEDNGIEFCGLVQFHVQ